MAQLAPAEAKCHATGPLISGVNLSIGPRLATRANCRLPPSWIREGASWNHTREWLRGVTGLDGPDLLFEVAQWASRVARAASV